MQRRATTTLLVLAVTAVALLSVGATSALAHGGGPGFGRAGLSNDLLADAAKRLGVSSAALEQAITDAAVARIDEAVAEDDLDEEDAADLKDEVSDNLRLAYGLSRTRAVAENLDTTAAQLNAAFREARKAAIVERIDEAVEDGDLEREEAAELKMELDSVRLPGYKPLSLGFGRRGPGGFGGFGFGHKHVFRG